jgi:UDP-N-acetylmuramoyl-tripeptide--D-alanyl-D-alanine ligase|tara:strand:+ start:38 stop:1429 length:1392 start_codon:yes stop_codon:yes gene_type:complete
VPKYAREQVLIGQMTLSALALNMNGNSTHGDAVFDSVSTDTRKLREGDLYIALVGENFDGNQFVGQAWEKGASGAIVSSEQDCELPQLTVVDTQMALGELASLNRQRSEAKLIALTGSQGKTTVKEMIGAILSVGARTLTTRSNLNNTIGVPLTLLELTEAHQFAVVEIGANAPGEIAYCVKLVEPDIALITNAAAAHLEGFGDLHGIVQAKGEIIDGLKEGGVLLLNADDKNFASWKLRAGDRKVISFSGSGEKSADYFAVDIQVMGREGIAFHLMGPQSSLDIRLNMLGAHNVVNALAAAALSLEAGASNDDVIAGLAGLESIKGRMSSLPGVNKTWLIDDTYNASPSSFRAAIDVLAAFEGRKILVVGDMKELGQETASAHCEVGKYARKKQIDDLLSVGEISHLSSTELGANGKHFPDKEQLVSACKSIMDTNTAVLVKGSRGAGMDEVVAGLVAREGL